MKEELQFLLSAKDNATPVFNKVGKSASKSLGDVEKQATTTGTKAATGFGGAFSRGLGTLGNVGIDKFLAVGAITAGVKFAVTAASSLQEATSKSQAVFREFSPEIEKWASTASKAFGQSKAQALEAAGTFGNLFQAFGVGLGPAKDMSMTLTQLASDLASFNNTTVDEAIQAIRSGLSGETEPLKRYGVALTDARLKQEALGLGLIQDVKQPLDAAAKSQAAYSLIMKDTALAQGDFARTSDGYANSMRTLQATVTDAAAALGAELLPSLSKLAGFAAKAITIIVDIKTKEEGKGGLAGFFDDALATATQDAGEIISDFWSHMTTGTAPWEDVNKVGDAVAKAIPMFDRFEARAAGVNTQLGYLGPITSDTSGRFAIMAMDIDRAAAAMVAEEEAARGALNAQLALFDSTFAVGDAHNQFATAVQAASTATDDASTAVNEQEVAYTDVAKAALGTASATLKYAEDQALLEGRTLSAEDSQKILIDTLYNLAGQAGGPTASAIGALITKLQITGQQKPQPTVTLNDQATNPLRVVGEKITGLNGRSATVFVSVGGGAEAQLANISRRLSALAATGTLVRATLPGVRFQEGGYVNAAKNQPVAATVHGGEYVLSADVVDRIKRGDQSRGADAASLRLPVGGGGGGSVVVNFNGTFLASKAELGRMVDEAVAESRRRGNRAA